MKLILLIVTLFIAFTSNAQGLEMTITMNQSEFCKYSRESQDTMFISCLFKNTGSERIIFRFSERYFMLKQNEDDGYGHSHCFRVYPADYRKIYDKYYERTKEDFRSLEPGEELVYRGAYSVSWICRSASPEGDWKLRVSYLREINAEDNYYIVKSDYSDKDDSVFVKESWTGSLNSNTLDIVVK